MSFLHRLILACLGMGIITGCQAMNSSVSTQPIGKSTIQPICQTEEPSPELIQVRTGGLLQRNVEIHRAAQETLTIRQLLLEVGGVRQPERTMVLREVANPQPAIQSVTVQTPSDLLPMSLSDRQRLEIIESIFADTETQSLKELFTEPNSTKWRHWKRLNADFVIDPAEYLRLNLIQINIAASYQPNGDWFDPDDREFDTIVSSAITLFTFIREKNPTYVDQVLGKLSQLKTTSTSANSSSTSKTVGPSSVPIPIQTQPQSAVKAVVEKAAVNELVLIGLARDGKTNYFHQSLIDHTALGEIPLKDKDFVFAIEAQRTSLRTYTTELRDFYVPVSGVAASFNSVLSSEHPTFREILGLVDATQYTDDSVFIIDRARLQKNASDTYHLPLAYLDTDFVSAKEILADSKVQPGDSIAFARAVNAPIVQSELLVQLERIRDRVKSCEDRNKPVLNTVNQSRIFRTASSFTESARYATRRFTSQFGK